MEDSWQQVRPRKCRRFQEPIPSRIHNFTSLMDEEWFLLMVFEHLVEYGLEECRLVCWRWYNVCRQFPVQLKRRSYTQLEKTVTVLPNVVSVSVDGSAEEVPDDKLFHCLASLDSLKSLTFSEHAITLTGRAQPYFRSIPQLTELDLDFSDVEGIEHMITSIKYLTNLTKLALVSRHRSRRALTDPFVELQKICDLTVGFDLFTAEDGTCLFPSLKCLTRLKLMSEWRVDEDHELSMEPIRHYASSLQHLSLKIHSAPTATNFTPLTSLTNLRTLEINRYCACYENLWETLKEMYFIAKLKTNFKGYMEEIMNESIAMLTELKAIDCEDLFMHSYEADDIPLASRMIMEQLRELAISISGALIPKLGRLTQLVHLKLSVYSDFSCSLNDALACMTNLQTLWVVFMGLYTDDAADDEQWGSVSVSSRTLANMAQLESLSLIRVRVDRFFFSRLASAMKLKKLQFASVRKDVYPQSFVSQIKLLRNLEELELSVASSCNICNFILPRYLPKLKKLLIRNAGGYEAIVRRRFGQALTDNRQSSWCSRHVC